MRAGRLRELSVTTDINLLSLPNWHDSLIFTIHCVHNVPSSHSDDELSKFSVSTPHSTEAGTKQGASDNRQANITVEPVGGMRVCTHASVHACMEASVYCMRPKNDMHLACAEPSSNNLASSAVNPMAAPALSYDKTARGVWSGT